MHIANTTIVQLIAVLTDISVLKSKLLRSKRESLLNLSGGLRSVSVTILLSSLDMSEMSHSAGSSGVSADGLGGPGVSSLGGTSSDESRSSLLEVEVALSSDSGDGVRVCMLLTSCWGSSRL